MMGASKRVGGGEAGKRLDLPDTLGKTKNSKVGSFLFFVEQQQ